MTEDVPGVKQILTYISVTVALHEKLKSLDPDNLSIFGPDGSPPNSRCAFSAISWGVICFFGKYVCSGHVKS